MRALFEVCPRNGLDVPATLSAELLSWLKSQQTRIARCQQAQQESRSPA